jgi:hypothetical protein
MRLRPNSNAYFARTLAIALACCLLLFLVQVVVHGHEKGQNDTVCRVCHAAHIGAGPAVNAALLCAPLLPDGHVRDGVVRIYKELLSNDSPSRAPPSI